MKHIILAALFAIGFTVAPAFAADKPAKFNKCKPCHGNVGKGGKVGPDLASSSWTVEEWNIIVQGGSKAEGRPAAREKYAKKKMPKQKGVSPEQVKAIFDYVAASK